jgi:hypothetical protein
MLGRALAERWGVRFFDTDEFLWEATEPPFTQLREPDERRRLLGAALDEARDWVIAGALCGWGDVMVPRFTAVVFTSLNDAVRLERLRMRERERYGERIESGGDLRASHLDFMAWAARYEEGDFSVRSRRLHEAWMERLPKSCRLLRVDSARSVNENLAMVVRELGGEG